MSKNKLLIVKVGSDERPAGPKDIKYAKKVVKKLQKKGMALRKYDVLVTHHAMDFDFLSVP